MILYQCGSTGIPWVVKVGESRGGETRRAGGCGKPVAPQPRNQASLCLRTRSDFTADHKGRLGLQSLRPDPASTALTATRTIVDDARVQVHRDVLLAHKKFQSHFAVDVSSCYNQFTCEDVASWLDDDDAAHFQPQIDAMEADCDTSASDEFVAGLTAS